MNDRTRQNVKSFLGSMNKQSAVRQLPAGQALQTQGDDAITYVPQQEQGGSWLGTLAKLGLGAGGAYGLYKLLQNYGGGGGGAGDVAQKASEAQRVLEKAYQEGTIPNEARGELRNLANQMISRGQGVQDFVNRVRHQYKDFGLGDRSLVPNFMVPGQATSPTWLEDILGYGDAPEELVQQYNQMMDQADQLKDKPYFDMENVIETRTQQ